MAEEKKNFEESLKKLEEISSKLKAEDITLEDAIKQYEGSVTTRNAVRCCRTPSSGSKP